MRKFLFLSALAITLFTITQSCNPVQTAQAVEPVGCYPIANPPFVGAVTGVTLSDGSRSCGLTCMWQSTGGACIALYVNGKIYKDPSTGYGLWSAAVNGIIAEPASVGTISGQTFTVFVREYCSTDTANSTRYDSPTTTYTAPVIDCSAPTTAPAGSSIPAKQTGSKKK